jgi:hypothetical protein
MTADSSGFFGLFAQALGIERRIHHELVGQPRRHAAAGSVCT